MHVCMCVCVCVYASGEHRKRKTARSRVIRLAVCYPLVNSRFTCPTYDTVDPATARYTARQKQKGNATNLTFVIIAMITGGVWMATNFCRQCTVYGRRVCTSVAVFCAYCAEYNGRVCTMPGPVIVM